MVNKQLKYILYIQYYFLCRLPPESFLCFSAEDSFAFGNTKSFTPSADLWYDKSKRRFHLGHWMAEDSRARFLKQLSSICPKVLKNAGVEANLLRDRFCSGKPSAIPSCSDLEHIFAPLFSAPVSVRISLLKLKVLEILIYLSNMKSEHKELTQYFSQQTELIKEIHQQLTEHLDQRFTIAELSKQYLINTSTLKEIFKAVYGQPIATYMKEFRVRQTMKLLRETNDTIADIASQVGYQTQGKFSSAFQSIVKMSPREYRKIQGIAPSDSFSKTL